MQLEQFIYNPFQENTYLLHNGKECIIIDPGCYHLYEKEEFVDFIKARNLKPAFLLNTHCHLDHVFSNSLVIEHFQIPFYCHKSEELILLEAPMVADRYGLFCAESPAPTRFIEAGESIQLGNEKLVVLFTPGHSPGSISFYNAEQGFVISGDVLFKQSIGRTDLPGGDLNILLQSIKYELFSLPDDTIVYSGHGPATTIGEEKRLNPYLKNI